MTKTQKFYLTVPKSMLHDILANGITPGINDGMLDRLPFLRGEIEKPSVSTGHAAYLEIEIPEDDPRYIEVNRRQCEYHDYVPVEKITGLAHPPSTNEETLKLFKVYGEEIDSPLFLRHWEFRDLSGELDPPDLTLDEMDDLRDASRNYRG